MNKKLDEKIESVKRLSIEELCEMFDCKPKDICLGDYIAKNTNHKVCPYKVILGFANFEDSHVESLGKLEVVYGKKLVDNTGPIHDFSKNPIYLGINLKNSKITDFGKVKKIYGGLTLNQAITSMGSVEFLGSNLYLNNTNIEDLGNLTNIDGILNLEDDASKCKLKSLGNLRKVRKLSINSNCLLDLGCLEEVKEVRIGTKCKHRIREMLENNLERSDTKYTKKVVKATQD